MQITFKSSSRHLNFQKALCENLMRTLSSAFKCFLFSEEAPFGGKGSGGVSLCDF